MSLEIDKEIKKELELEDKRNYLIVKSNELVQKTIYSLTEQEQKVVLYFISQIKPNDNDFYDREISIKELCDIFEIEYNNKNYDSLQNSIQKLSDKSCWIISENKKILFRWFERVQIDRDKLIVKVRLHNILKPHLLNLQDNTTIYLLKNILPMSGRYAPRLYEILKSYLYQKEYSVSIVKLKEILGLTADKYTVFKDFNKRVIAPAIEEINTYTDIYAEVTPIKTGRRITDLCFTIATNPKNKGISFRLGHYKKPKRKKVDED